MNLSGFLRVFSSRRPRKTQAKPKKRAAARIYIINKEEIRSRLFEPKSTGAKSVRMRRRKKARKKSRKASKFFCFFLKKAEKTIAIP